MAKKAENSIAISQSAVAWSNGAASGLEINVDLLPDPAGVFTSDGTILKVNAALAELFEADNGAELLGKSLYSTGELKEHSVAAAVAQLEAGRSIHLEMEVVTLKRNRRSLQIVGVPVVTPGGKVERVIGFFREISELRQSERERALLAAVVESSGDAVVSAALDGTLVSWNHRAEEMFGFAQAEAIGQSFLIIVPPQNRPLATAMVEEVKANRGRVMSYEGPALRKDGSSVETSMMVFGVYDRSGELVGIASILRDITGRKRAESEQALLAAVVNSSDDAIYIVSDDFEIKSWNSGAEKLFGFSAKEAIGQKIVDLYVPSEQRPIAEQMMREDHARMKQDPNFVHRLEQRATRKDGQIIDLWIVASGIYDKAGEWLGISNIVRDITARGRTEGQLATLASIVNASEDAIIGYSKDIKMTVWNPAAERLYGFTAKEAVGSGFDLFVPPDELGPALEADRRVLETGESVTFEQRAQKKDGTWFISLVNIFAIRDESGTIIGGAGIGRDITRFKQIEAELRESHEYTRGLIESSVDAMVIVDPDMRISDGNEQLTRLTELPKKVLFGSRFDSHFSEPAKARAAVEKALADGYVTNVDLTLRAASGKQVPISFNASLFYRAGKVFGIFGVARDVTVERATERTLREEREYSRSLVQSSPDALLVSDSGLMLADVNERALELSRYRREELIGSKLTALFTEPPRALEALEHARDAGPVHDVELVLLTRIAEEIPVALNASALRDGEGANRRVVVAIRDVSESKRAQKANSLLASIVDSSGDAIYSETIEMVITSWNPAAERLFGFSAAEVVGRCAALLVPLDRRSELPERMQEIRQDRKAQQYETVRLRKDGSAVDVAVTQSPILDSAGAVTALSVTVRDIGERKRLEAEFIKARDAAMEGARLKSEFLANMSHEIRTPLNSIIGMTGLLLDTELNSEQREFAGDVRESGDALLSLVNNILDFSKIAAGKFTFEEVDFELTDMLDGAVELVASQAGSKGLELTVSVDPEVPRFLHGDPGRLRQVLLNLLSNAVKFTAHGEVAVAVSKLSENPKEAILRFEVHDNGIGIPPDKLHLLFQPFSQVDASTSRHFGGTGLGLSIVRELVERMGGSVAVTSTPGNGSTFWFTVKLAKQVDKGHPASERFASLADARVLIVDDNANNRRILDRQVTSWGMKSATAAAGAEALEMLRSAAKDGSPYKVALLDVMMPDMDGIEVARLIKNDPALAATAVIFLSSAGPSSEFQALLKGIETGGWLMKPVPESTLYNSFVKVLPLAALATSETAPSHAPTAKLPAHRVLVAEDNPINQKVARLQLQKLGLEVDLAANGREAVQAVMREHYDIVLMDCQMPEMDGYDATREIRRREAGASHIMIVAMTAHALPGDREKCLAAGMDGYVSKPVTLEALNRELTAVLATRAASQQNGITSAQPNPATPPAVTASGNGKPSLA